MNKKDTSLTKICEQLEGQVSSLQNSLTLLRQEVERIGIRRAKPMRHAISVRIPGTGIICERDASGTLMKVIEQIGVEKVYKLHIGTPKRPLISKSPKTSQYRPDRSGEYYILTGSNTDEKIKHLQEIASYLDIRMRVEDRRKK